MAEADADQPKEQPENQIESAAIPEVAPASEAVPGPTAALPPELAVAENRTNPRTPAEEAWLSSRFPRGVRPDALDRLSIAYRSVMATGAIERGSPGYFKALAAAIK
jgi:hypothetical protein